MTYPRSHMLDPVAGGIYHVHSRCVRRAWLCGRDAVTGRNFDHRRAWIERRIHWLASIFPVSICAYAVMSNHYHLVLRVSPSECTRWSAEEVIDRWLTLCPGRRGPHQNRIREARKSELLGAPQQIRLLRARLGSLSWFMRFINEPLARISNREDDCTGRFWEGRFKSQLLLDQSALLACMAYVDLNPVRAGLARSPEQSAYTSIRFRLRFQSKDEEMAAMDGRALPIDPLTLREYTDILRWTARAQEHYRQGILDPLPDPIARRNIAIDEWLQRYAPKPRHWCRAVGSLDALTSLAKDLGQSWIKSWFPIPS